MKIKTSDLNGPALDWAVARIEMPQDLPEDIAVWVTPLPCDEPDDRRYQPSSYWAQGGPIIEREKIRLMHTSELGAEPWSAIEGKQHYAEFGPTPLIAAMRCFVASKLGDEVEIPDEVYTGVAL